MKECQFRSGNEIQPSATLLTVSVLVVQVLFTGGFSGRAKTTVWPDGIDSVFDCVVVFTEGCVPLELDFLPFLAGFGFFLISLSVPSGSKRPLG